MYLNVSNASVGAEAADASEKFDRDGLPVCAPQAKIYTACKRALDVVLVIAATPAIVCLIALCALLIVVTMGRPIFFTQERVGLNGRPFMIWKLRTMRMVAAPQADHATLERDPRVTAFGRALRSTHVDELPQLWNILCGDMTLIGPRPEQPHFVEKYRQALPDYDVRHSVRPGLSGWSQVKFGYAADLEETRQKLKYDLQYIKRYGPAIDCEIALRTLLIFLNPKYVR